MAWVGFFGSRYLAAYQLGYIDHVWDPFFGDGTIIVLDSEVSKSFPISDGGLCNVSYTIEALTGYMGMSNRWRTMPWMVAFFGIFAHNHQNVFTQNMSAGLVWHVAAILLPMCDVAAIWTDTMQCVVLGK